jgi:hypothetical protein
MPLARHIVQAQNPLSPRVAELRARFAEALAKGKSPAEALQIAEQRPDPVVAPPEPPQTQRGIVEASLPKIRELAKSMTREEVARAIGVQGSSMNWAHKNGLLAGIVFLSRQAGTEKRHKAILDRFARLKSAERVAADLGISKNTVLRVLRENASQE